MSDAKELNLTEQEQSLGALLRLPYEALVRDTYDRLAETGFDDVRPSHGVVFRYILPEGSRVTDLAERAQMTKQSMAYLVESLHERRYVQMSADPLDGRAKIVRLTRRGKAVQRAALNVSKQIEENLASQLADGEFTKLRSLLGQLSVRMRRSHDQGSAVQTKS